MRPWTPIREKLRRSAMVWLGVGLVLTLIPAALMALVLGLYVPEEPRPVHVGRARASDQPPPGLVIVQGLLEPMELGEQIETHYQTRLRIKTGERVVARYQVLPVGQRLLVVESPEGVNTRIVMGRLRPLDSGIRRDIIAPLLQKHPKLQGRIHPWMLEVGQPFSTAWAWTVFPLLMLPGLLIAACGGAFLLYPSLQPAAQRLARFGRWEDVAARLDEDLRDSGTSLGGGRVQVTPRWVVVGCKVLRVEDLVGIRCDMPIRPGDPARLVLFTATENSASIHLKPDEARSLLKVVQTAAPWVMVGGWQVETAWRTGLETLLAVVELRRQVALARPEPHEDGSPDPNDDPCVDAPALGPFSQAFRGSEGRPSPEAPVATVPTARASQGEKRDVAEAMAVLTPLYAGAWLLPLLGLVWPMLLVPKEAGPPSHALQTAMLGGMALVFVGWVLCMWRSGPALQRVRDLRGVQLIEVDALVRRTLRGLHLLGHLAQDIEMLVKTNRWLAQQGVELGLLGPTPRARRKLREEAASEPPVGEDRGPT